VPPLLPFSNFSAAACFLLYSKYQICSNSSVLQTKYLHNLHASLQTNTSKLMPFITINFSPLLSSISHMPPTDYVNFSFYNRLCCSHMYVQGEHKKSSPPTTFVDISAKREDFCMKFHTTVKQSNIHFVTKFG